MSERRVHYIDVPAVRQRVQKSVQTKGLTMGEWDTLGEKRELRDGELREMWMMYGSMLK